MMTRDVILDRNVKSSWNAISEEDRAQIRDILRSHNLLAPDGDIVLEPDPVLVPEPAVQENAAHTVCIAACDAAAAKAELECEAIDDPATCIACAIAVRAAQQACYRSCPI
jgi:hypothetical protein